MKPTSDRYRPGSSTATTWHLASDLRAAAHKAGVELHQLAYNRFAPELTTWWLSPASDNPAFAFGKVVVESSNGIEDGAWLVGLHVEKGVGPSAAPMFMDSPRDERAVLRPDWTWNAFRRALISGSVDADLAAAVAAAGPHPVVVEVVASLAWPRRADSEEFRPVNPDTVERLGYRCRNGRLDLASPPGTGLLRVLDAVETLPSIARKLDAAEKPDWTWLEIIIGIPVMPGGSPVMAPDELWRRACAPWLKWLR